MSTPDFDQVCEALAASVRNLAGLLSVTKSVPDKLSPPCGYVQAAPGDFIRFRPTLDDAVDYLLLVTINTPGADAAAGQAMLAPYLRPSGPTSVAAAINGDPRLGGVVQSARCNFARNYRAETWDEQRVIAVDFPVEILT